MLLLARIPRSFFNLSGKGHRPGIDLHDDGSLIVMRVCDAKDTSAGARVGDIVDTRGLFVGDRVRLITAPFMSRYAMTSRLRLTRPSSSTMRRSIAKMPHSSNGSSRPPQRPTGIAMFRRGISGGFASYQLRMRSAFALAVSASRVGANVVGNDDVEFVRWDCIAGANCADCCAWRHA